MANVTDFSKEISYASKVVANQWPGVIEADDVEQELYLLLLERPGSVEKLATMTSEERRNSLVHVGHQIGSRYKNDYELFSGNCYYGTEHVRAILESGLLTVARRDLGDMKETLTDFLDLHEAFDYMKRVSEEYAQIVWSYYVEGSYDTGTGARYERLRRAIRSLTELMNQAHRRRSGKFHQGPGARKAISNEKARIISQRQYAGRNDGFNSFAQ